MCGISGSLSLGRAGYSLESARIQYNLMLASTMRGVDGTGVIIGGLDHTEGAVFRKGIEAAHEVVSRHDMESMTRDGRWVIAHTRAATLGGITIEACHPFNEDMVIGVHNGTIHNTDVDFPDHKGINDSETIYKAISAKEPTDAVDVLKLLDPGAYVLVWYDARIKALRFARNDERPLWFHKRNNMWWWHSEPGAIASCLSRTYAADPLGYRDIVPTQLKINTLLTVPINGDPATAEEYTPTYVAPAGASWNDSSWWENYYNGSYDPWDYDRRSPTKGNTWNDGWITVTSALDIWNCCTALAPLRASILGSIGRIFKTIAPSNVQDFRDCLDRVACSAGGGDMVGTVDFIGQVYSDTSGMVYGGLDVAGHAPMPVVGKLSPIPMIDYEEALAEELRVTPKSTRVPLFRGTLTNLKVYAEGSIGMGVEDLEFAGWEAEGTETLTEEAVGSLNTHPHLMQSTWEKDVDWSIWDPIPPSKKPVIEGVAA